MGWTGEGNIGDESMYLAHQEYLSDIARLVPLPSLADNALLRRTAPRLDAVCLGGGTLIGNGHFGSALAAVAAAAPDVPFFMIGTGSEDAEYTLGRRADIAGSLQRWRGLLERFPDVNVRGPRSVQVLAGLGVSATATGDPALALPWLQRRPVSSLVGVNIGETDDQWGSADGATSGFADDLVGALLDAGHTVRLCPTTTDDHSHSVSLARRFDHRVQCPSRPLGVLGFLHWVAECGAVVALKLHAQILATTQRVPVVALEYRPKCADFMESIDRMDRCMRTDAVDVPTIVEWIRTDLADHHATQIDIDRAVTARQVALAEAFTRAREVLTGLSR